AVRNALRREPREAERARAIKGETGPWRRIFDAGVAGARFAREQVRQQRQANERPSRVRLGVCEQCGAVVAAASLQAAEVGPARRTLRVCVACRAAETAKAAPEPPRTQDTREADTVDADIVPDQPERGRPQIDRARPEIEAPDGGKPTAAPEPARPAPTPRPAVPPAPQPAPEVDQTPQIEQGEPMAPRAPGHLVPRHSNRVAARAARGRGGETYTHGQWDRAVRDIETRLDALPAVL